MFNINKKQLNWGDAQLTLESGRLARQAHGSVLATLGKTVVLCTVTADDSDATVDFLPLSVHYIERSYAAGRIPGGFFKREGRPSEHEILTSRLIDRALRPLFDKHWRRETQVICTVLGHDMENEPDVVAMIGTSAALMMSGLPFAGPIGAVRVGRMDDKFVLNPTLAEREESSLDLVVAATASDIMMVESQAADLPEQVMLDALKFGHESMQEVIKTIGEFAKDSSRPKLKAETPPSSPKVEKAVAAAADKITAAYKEKDKQVRHTKLEEAKSAINSAVGDETLKGEVGQKFKELEKGIVRGAILATGTRIDGRKADEIRPIECAVGVLAAAHGSALFTRGETQALVVSTLGTGPDEQIIDALPGSYRRHFMLHYNFPPYSVGETGRIGAIGRREVGHGKLAWRALRWLMPDHEEFPYTIRVVSEITESNGSSSMATVCGSSLALMDAGVPLKKAVAGIAMGLVKEGGKFVVLSDILGDEDHLGDMDFKVAGTKDGITALQMDIKIGGLTLDIMSAAVKQASEGKEHILSIMEKSMDVPRAEINANAPRIEVITVPKHRIREIIGTGGKVIRELCEVTGAQIDIDDDGTVKVSAVDTAAIEDAKRRIEAIVAEPEVGRIYDGKVVKCVDFGAFVNFLGAKDGLVHISELEEGRVKRTTDVVNEGDRVKVKVLDVDGNGRVRLSMRGIDQG